MASIELSTFVGEWCDSLGNAVHVRGSPRSGLQVLLAKPDAKGKEIQLSIQKVGPTSYLCGHYELDEEFSSPERVFWRDRRWKDRVTVWTRVTSLPEDASNPCALAVQPPVTLSLSQGRVWRTPPTASQHLAKPRPTMANGHTWETPPVPSCSSTALPLGWAAAHAPALRSRVMAPKAAAAPGGALLQGSAAPGNDESDWSHVLNVLANARSEVSPGMDPNVPAWQLAAKTEEEAEEGEEWEEVEEECWSEVLDLWGSAEGESGQPTEQEEELFLPFAPPQAPAAEAPASEELRERVLQETLARLPPSRAHSGAAGLARPRGAAAVRAPRNAAATASVAARAAQEETLPDWQRRPQGLAGLPAPKRTDDALLENFIRVFGLDHLAAKWLRALSDDEAAYIIESCQRRLKYAKNPSAVVMIAIRGVASKVGRRYFGNRAAELRSQCAAPALGGGEPEERPLQVYEGMPSQPKVERVDPPEEVVIDDEDEDEVDTKRRRTTDVTEAPEASEDSVEALFFVDTGDSN